MNIAIDNVLLPTPRHPLTKISVLFHAIYTDNVDESWQTISHSLKEVYTLSGASKSFKTMHALCGRL
jgi:lipopolysaccharide biosynthesis protein